MQFEFKQDSYNEQIYNNLDLASFLKLFRYDLPFLEHQILPPLSKEAATDHFLKLSELLNLKFNWEELLNIAKNLPNIDSLLAKQKDDIITQHELYTTFKLINAENKLSNFENKPNVSNKGLLFTKLNELVSEFTTDSGKSLKLTSRLNNIKTKIEQKENDIKKNVEQIENEIFKKTDIKFIYPYAKEILFGDKRTTQLQNCLDVEVKNCGDYFSLSIKKTKQLSKSEKELEELNQSFQKDISILLKQCSNIFFTLQDDLKLYYKFRTTKLLQYIILNSTIKHKLAIPVILDHKFSLSKGRLPLLEESNKKNYRPLNLDLTTGSTMLFGGNMSGKTTVLKTLSFHLQLVQMGLPIPGESLSLPFPEKHDIHLKSSGDITKGLSSFGEELTFFANTNVNYNFVLVDELFQSTNPTAGAALAKIFATKFKSQTLFFIFTSFYTELLETKEINLLRMKDFTINSIKEQDIAIIKKQDIEQLEIALNFAITEDIKEEINKKIKDK